MMIVMKRTIATADMMICTADMMIVMKRTIATADMMMVQLT